MRCAKPFASLEGTLPHRRWQKHELNLRWRWSGCSPSCLELQQAVLAQVLSANFQVKSRSVELENFMKTFFAMMVGVIVLLTGGLAAAQSGSMMGGGNSGFGWMGGYGGFWMPVLLIVVVVALVVLVIQRKDK